MRWWLALALFVAGCATIPEPLPIPERAASWRADVARLAADDMAGRAAGSAGYHRAAHSVAARFAALGLEPAGGDGFFQEVALEERAVLHDRSSAALVATGRETPLRLPDDLYFRARGGPPPARVDAPLLFVGYGLHIPEAGHDDFAGLDLRGAIVVFISGGPERISGPVKSQARDQRARLLVERGAVGAISITTAAQAEAPWSRAPAAAALPGMYFADPAMQEPGPFLTIAFNPAQAERLFARSGHHYAEIAARADASQPVPVFALNQSLRAVIATRATALTAPNIVARLRGRDRRLAAEHVILSAHLDGLGVGRPVQGDAIYNGALDNAAGVAALIDIAAQFRRQRVRPRRSILFVVMTGEEKGLLGSRYFARRPTVPRRSIVADLNYDMALPLFPLRSVTALGAEESSLGADAAAVGAALGLPLAPDPFPNRNSFTRSDQYSFIEAGIPSLAFKFGFAPATPEADIERAWRATHYHAPSDDLSQPIMAEDEIRLHDFIAALALRVANAPHRPRWNDGSTFRRFARE